MTDRAVPPLDELLARREWVRRFARTLVRDDFAADDLAQDALLAAVEKPPRDARAPTSWFRRVLRNRAVDVARATTRRDDHETAASRPDESPATADIVAAAESHRRVVEAVMALDEPYRTTVVLRFFEGLAPRHVATRMNVPVETVRSRTRRAVETLRLRLGEKYGDRRAWLAPLFAADRRPPTPIAAATKGVIAMTATKKAAAAAVLLIVGGVGFGVLSGDAHGVRSTLSPPIGSSPPFDVAGGETFDLTPSGDVTGSHLDAQNTTPSAAPAADGARDFVVTATDAAGRVVEGVRIGVHVKGGQVKRDTGSDFSVTRTDAAGRATFRVAGDVESVWAEPTDRTDYLFRGGQVSVAPGAAQARVVVERRAWIAGKVVGDDGAFVAKAFVAVLDRGRNVAATFTEDDGRFRIGVPVGGLFDVAATGLVSGVRPEGELDFFGECPGVASGAENVVVRTRPPTEKRPLRVRCETQDGRPLADVKFFVSVPTGREPPASGKSDAAGRVEFADVPDRRVAVGATKDVGETPAWESAGWISPGGRCVRPGGDEIVFVFARGRAIRGRVDVPADAVRLKSPDGKPQRMLVIVQTTAEWDVISTALCDDDGRFTVWAPADSPGPFRVSAGGWTSPDAKTTYLAQQVEAAAGAQDVVLKIAALKQ